jgi:NAD(P)-dependent dehydrogenase (short-subunit alcohol dehydrogenase family)
MIVNLFGGLELARIISRRDVIDPAGGSLLFFSSVYGRVGVPGQTGYSASKGAVTAAVRSMAIELARRRIRVNAISPGFVMTPMTGAALDALSPEQIAAIEQKHPLGRGAAVDVARAALFLLAPGTTWITGVDLPVDGGYSAQ